MRNLTRVALVVGIGISSTMFATENRTPWIAERGPLRYTFEKLHTDKYNFNSWWVGHYKEAHKAFDKHSVHTKPLSAVIFNKADFYLSEIFPNSTVPGDVENYNPYLDLTKYSPRVYYTEYGMTFGARWDYKVWKKGRIGLRGQMPFRTIEMERQDWVDETADPSDDVVKNGLFRVLTTHEGKAVGAGTVAGTSSIMATAYNFKFVQNLIKDKMQSIVSGATNDVLIQNVSLAFANNAGNSTIHTALVGTDEKTGNPLMYAVNFADDLVTAGFAKASLDNVTLGNGALINVPNKVVATNEAYFQSSGNTVFEQTAGKTLYKKITKASDVDVTADNLYFFTKNDDVDYKTLLADSAFQEKEKGLWLVFKRASNAGDNNPLKFNDGTQNTAGAGKNFDDGIKQLLPLYKENPFEFIHEQGFDLDTQKLSSIGDIDLDFFYEHTFNDSWIGELFVGVRFPTGGDKDCYGTPYRPQTGNGEHWEIKLGAMMAWQPLNWMNAKLDAYYSFALEATEHRMAAFKGATIKNFGPRADADIDWGYFVGRLDFTFFHPKTDNIRAQVGYEFYYKTEDHLNFKASKMNSWLGNKADGSDNQQTLDKHVAEANTEAIAHKIRGETSVMINKYMEAYVSASTTFAGQHVMRDRDVQGGFNMRF